MSLYYPHKDNLMRYVFLFLIFSLAWAADPVPKLPADVQRVVDARDAEVAKAKAVYDAAVAKATAVAVKQMEVVIKARMAKQDLDGAVAAKGMVEKWKSEEPKGDDLLGDKPKNDDLVGQWQVAGIGRYQIKEDNTANLGTINGKWSIKGKKFIIVWDNGYTDTYDYPPKKGVMSGINSSNNILKATKMEQSD